MLASPIKFINTIMIGTESDAGLQIAGEDSTITLKEFLEKQRELELEAAAALPFKFDRCSAAFGPLRQNLHICLNCPFGSNDDEKIPRAFCYSCAVICHEFEPPEAISEDPERDAKAMHSIEEIWARRNFICDCPATGNCKLLSQIPEAYSSHRNSYHCEHNFYGRYCYCEGKGWAAGDRTMYQCEICEDWFHDDCVAERNPQSSGQIPEEDSFVDFICAECVQKNCNLFSQISLNDLIFTVPKTESLVIDSNLPLFLAQDWRKNLRDQLSDCGKNKFENLEHLFKEDEPVFEPEIDTEAKESLYDRKER